MMTKINEKVKEVDDSMSKLQTEFSVRIDNMKNLLSSLENDVVEANESQSNADGKITTIENEIKLHENNIVEEKKSTESLEAKLKQINPDLESKTITLTELETKISELNSQKDQLDKDIQENTRKKSELEKEKSEKQVAFEDLEASIDKDLEKNKVELEEIKNKYAQVLESNIIWDYMFGKIETPEIEIMAIIAANREITLDDIKTKATSVSPVFVGRAISKLEADGKIVNKNDKWDLSPSLLEAIKS